MSWAVGEFQGRDIGYGVPAMCDHPGCPEKIDRGLSYVCGGDVYGGEHGCGLFFCSKHLIFNMDGKPKPQRCERCFNDGPAFDPTPDIQEWIDHKATDPSWAAWRAEQGVK